MTGVLLAAIISTLSLEGDVAEEDGPYVVVPFEVPEGTVEIQLQIRDESAAATLDFGLEGPDGFRGWCGRYDQPLVIGEEESTRCYLTGPIVPGEWRVDIGAAHLAGETVHWTATLEFRRLNYDYNNYELQRTGQRVFCCELYTDPDGNLILLENRPITTGDSVIDATPGTDQYARPAVNVTLDHVGRVCSTRAAAVAASSSSAGNRAASANGAAYRLDPDPRLTVISAA